MSSSHSQIVPYNGNQYVNIGGTLNQGVAYNSVLTILNIYCFLRSTQSKAIDLDQNNLKAHFFAGQAHLGLNQYEEALTRLVHAHNLALEQHRNFGDDITSVIRLARKKRFEAMDEDRQKEEISLQVIVLFIKKMVFNMNDNGYVPEFVYLNNLIMEDAARQKQVILSKLSGINGSLPNVEPTKNVSIDLLSAEDNNFENISPKHQEILSKIDNTAQKYISELNELFCKVDERRKKREIPDYLCGRISFDLMRDPVITPCGITYDRPSIISHLRQVGHFDPVSRQPLIEDQLIPNLSMREVVQAFLNENPWAETL
uniref:E3 ubiquitin-protein ligase CHIP n=1 Tax=Schistosoma haematobium TaxID=6185 RepID=A0A095A7J5_SCHHA